MGRSRRRWHARLGGRVSRRAAAAAAAAPPARTRVAACLGASKEMHRADAAASGPGRARWHRQRRTAVGLVTD